MFQKTSWPVLTFPNDSKVDDEKVEILKRMPQWVELSVDLDGFGEGWTKGFGDGLAILIIFCR